MTRIEISGVGIELSNPQIKECETAYEISKLGLFNHLPFEDKEKSENKLCLELGIKDANDLD
jgi:hypothetical protein